MPKNVNAASVFVVDDNPDVCGTVVKLLRGEGLLAEGFLSPESFLESVTQDTYGCLIADLMMPGMSGLDLQHEILSRELDLCLIFMTGHADVSSAKAGLKAGAVDYLEKPVSPDALISVVRDALKMAEERREARLQHEELSARFSRLTKREREIMGYLSRGLTAKQIGRALTISPRTAEIHRSRVMEKLCAGSLADLVAMSISFGIR